MRPRGVRQGYKRLSVESLPSLHALHGTSAEVSGCRLLRTGPLIVVRRSMLVLRPRLGWHRTSGSSGRATHEESRRPRAFHAAHPPGTRTGAAIEPEAFQRSWTGYDPGARRQRGRSPASRPRTGVVFSVQPSTIVTGCFTLSRQEVINESRDPSVHMAALLLPRLVEARLTACPDRRLAVCPGGQRTCCRSDA